VARSATPKRVLFLVLGALVAAGILASGAPAGDFADEPCGVSGDVYACPGGYIGTPYNLTFKLKGDEDLGCATFKVSSGNFPPGLSLSSKGVVSGTPIAGGDFTFYVTVSYSCPKPKSDRRFRIPINPPLPPALSITNTTVAPGTVGAAYSTPLTASRPDPTSWSVVSGALPPGVTLGATDGLLAGTPTTAGSFPFAVQAFIDAERKATKSFTLNVRDPLAVTGPTEPPLEVGVYWWTALKGSGGLRTYTWKLTAGAVPPGLTFFPGGAITGRPTEAGEYRFTVTLTDKEGRAVNYDGLLNVAEKLSIATTQLKLRVGRSFRKQVLTAGGVEPVLRLKKGPLPGGVRFDPRTGSFVGTPTKAGTWTVIVEAKDSLKVKAKGTIALVVAP
jgi:large repetitive protein